MFEIFSISIKFSAQRNERVNKVVKVRILIINDCFSVTVNFLVKSPKQESWGIET